MTISSTTRKAGPFDGNDVTTSFPFTFKVFATTDVRVVFTNAAGTESDLVIDSDYSVTLNGDQDASPGGTISYPLSGDPLATGEKLTVVGDIDALQETDLTNQGGFYPQVIENAFDRLTMLLQQVEEELARSIRLAISDDAASGTQLPAADSRASKVLGFDNTGAFQVYDTITGTSVGVVQQYNETAIEGQTEFTLPFTFTPNVNAIHVFLNGSKLLKTVDYTEDANDLIVLTAGATAGDLFEAVSFGINTDAAATVSALASQVAADAVATAADRVQTGLDAVATAADRVQTGLDADATAADRVQTGLDADATAADRAQTGLDAVATAADRVQTGLDASTATTQAGTATTQAGIATTQAGIATTQAGIATTKAGEANDSAIAAAASAAAAAASYDSFDDRYLGAKAADPTLDNDGNALLTGALYWNTAASNLRVYNGSTWEVVGATTAAAVSFAPAGNVAAITVQAAIEELDTEKVPQTQTASTTVAGIVELATDAEAQAGTDTARAITAANLAAANILFSTAVAASTTAVDFNGIPSWAKRVTVMFEAISTSGTDNILVQLGTSGGIVSSGYAGSASNQLGGVTATFSAGFAVVVAVAAANSYHGLVILEKISGNKWVASSQMAASNTAQVLEGAGSVSLAGTLDRLRVATAGTNTFDAGNLNITWE